MESFEGRVRHALHRAIPAPVWRPLGPDVRRRVRVKQAKAVLDRVTRDYKRLDAFKGKAISQEEWEQFLRSWWHLAPGTLRQGRAGPAEVCGTGSRHR